MKLCMLFMIVTIHRNRENNIILYVFLLLIVFYTRILFFIDWKSIGIETLKTRDCNIIYSFNSMLEYWYMWDFIVIFRHLVNKIQADMR